MLANGTWAKQKNSKERVKLIFPKGDFCHFHQFLSC